MRCTSDQGPRPAAPAGRAAPDGPFTRQPPRRARGGRSRRLGAGGRRFARDESGTVTVEAVIWLPFLFVLLALITDISLAFFSKAEAFRAIQNGNRLYSINRLDDEAEVETWVESVFSATAPSAVATTVTNADRTLVATQVAYPVQSILLFTNVPDSWMIRVQSQHYVEWPNP